MSVHVAPGCIIRARVHLSAHLPVALETNIARAVVGERHGGIQEGALGIQRAHAPVNRAWVNGCAARRRAAALTGGLATARIARAADALDTRTTLGTVGLRIAATIVHRTETRIDTCLAVAQETFVARAFVLGGAKELAIGVLRASTPLGSTRVDGNAWRLLVVIITMDVKGRAIALARPGTSLVAESSWVASVLPRSAQVHVLA